MHSQTVLKSKIGSEPYLELRTVLRAKMAVADAEEAALIIYLQKEISQIDTITRTPNAMISSSTMS